jgi:hypothetical protein
MELSKCTIGSRWQASPQGADNITTLDGYLLFADGVVHLCSYLVALLLA